MNTILKGSALTILASAASAPMLSAATSQSESPNILFILVDDFRYDALGFCGNPIVHTPAIDALASKGVLFQNAFSSTPISSASRASILTGLQERTHRYTFQTGPLEESLLEQAYPLALREVGYNTALFGKLGVVCSDSDALFDEIEDYDRDDTKPDRRGYYYQQINGETVHLTRYTGQQGLDYIDKQSGDEPFFLSLCFSAPHAHDGAKEQYFWDKEQDHLFQDVTIPDPAMSSDKDFEKLPEFLRNSFSRLRWTWRFDTPEKYQEMMKGYYRMIAGVDAEIEKVMAKLEEKGLADNTVVIFMGDNGYFLGERQLADKWLMYDLSVRVPLIIYDPRIEHKEVSDCQALNIDIPATIADYAGAEQQPQWQGTSLKPWVYEQSPEWDRDTILLEHLWELPMIPASEGIRTNKWKYFRYINDKRVEELYDLENDPSEANNLAQKSRYRDILLEMRAKTDEMTYEKSANGVSDAPYSMMVDRTGCCKESAEAFSTQPLFSWQVPLRAQSQKGYQILVSSTMEGMRTNIGDMWNSGVVADGCSTGVIYKGESLERGKTYYWKVRLWDYLNRTTEYSSVQSFTVAAEGTKSEAYAMCRVTNFEISDEAIQSLCGDIASKSGVVSQIPMKIWGIESDAADYKTLYIDPNMSGLESSTLNMQTIRGEVVCDYVKVTPLVDMYHVTVPANMTAEFVLPSSLSATVLLNKKVVNLNHRRLQLQPGVNSIELQINTF